MSNGWKFVKQFLLVPAMAVGGFTTLALFTEGWTQALGIGLLAGVAFTAWVLSSVLAWKIAHDARQELKAAEADLRDLYDRQAVYEEHNL